MRSRALRSTDRDHVGCALDPTARNARAEISEETDDERDQAGGDCLGATS